MIEPPKIEVGRAFVKVHEAATILGISSNQVRNHIDLGNLYSINVSATKVRRSLRVAVKSIEQFAAKRRAE